MGRATGSGDAELTRRPADEPPYSDYRADIYLSGLVEALQEAAETYMRENEGRSFDDIGGSYPHEGFEVRSYESAIEVLFVPRPRYGKDGHETDGVSEVRFGPIK